MKLTEEQINKTNKLLLNKGIITTQDFYSMGIDKHHIKKLLDAGKLRRVKIGAYLPTSCKDLFFFARKLFLTETDPSKAYAGFHVCQEIEPQDRQVNFMLLLEAVSKENYRGIEAYLEVLSTEEKKNYKNDTNYFMFLLSFITHLEGNINITARQLNLEDMLLDHGDSPYQDIDAHNTARRYSFNREFREASFQIESLSAKRKLVNREYLIKMLNEQAYMAQRKLDLKLMQLIFNGRFALALQALEEESARRRLNQSEEMYIFLLRDIVKMINRDYKGIVMYYNKNTDSLYEQVHYRNYEKSLYMSRQTGDAVLTELLEACIKYRNRALNVPEEESSKSNVHESDPLTQILTSLTKEDTIGALNILHTYLGSNDLLEYEYLIRGLIELSILEGDTSFFRPMHMISSLKRGEFTFDIQNITQELTYYLKEKRPIEAKTCLNIVYEARALGHVDIDDIELTNLLKKATDTKKKKKKRKKKVLQPIKGTD